MNRFKRIKQLLALVLLVLFLAAPALAGRPKYVFYLIGDGLGASQRQISEFFLQEQTRDKTARLRMNSLEVAGLTTTYCADSLVTDSAAAGTALASGIKTNQGVVGKDPGGRNVRTLMEAARDAGMKTGIITTTRLTHATPAAFVAHNISRDNENDIALDFLASRVDFLAGGGLRHFLPQQMETGIRDAIDTPVTSKRRDPRNLIREFEEKGYHTFVGQAGAREFRTADFTGMDKTLALFTSSHLPYEIERTWRYPEVPTLAAMTQAGITALNRGKKGFFLVVEGGRIDHACHSNDITGAIHDTLAFDLAVETAFAFYTAHPADTLILVVGDHETGGLGLGMDGQGYSLNLAALLKTRISVQDALTFGDAQYRGDRAAFTAILTRDFGLDALSETETARLTQAFDAADAGVTLGYYKVNPAAMTAAHLLSERANLNWTTTLHTGTMIPMSAAGKEAARLGGYKDNTEIARTLADIMGFSL